MASKKSKNIETSQTYWAGPESDTRTCGDAVMKRIEDYYTWCWASGWMDRWLRLYNANYPNYLTNGTTINTGENGQYRTAYVNHFTNLLEHVQSLSITDRPAWQAMATNSDSESMEQTIIAKQALDYYMREKKVERYLGDATSNALLFCEGFVSVLWDPDLGETLAQDDDTGEQRKQGDLRYRSYEPVDIIRDPNMQKFYDRTWLVARDLDNKFDLAIKYPDYAEEIIAQQLGAAQKDHYLAGMNRQGSTESDQIVIYTFYHGKTPSCPDGRQMTLLEDGTVLTDSILLYDKIPLYRIVCNDQKGTPMGKSVSMDMLPIQEMIDAHWTTILSTNENFGIQKIMMPIGSNIEASTLGPGMTVVTYNSASGKPEVMEMPSLPPSITSTLDNLVEQMQILSGVNAVSRGNPPPSLQSGSALALVQSMAVQFNAPLQQSYVGLLEDVGTATIQILKDYADSDRVIQLVGEKNKGMIQKAFSGKDISNISRVQVQAGNAMSKTTSGRLAIAESLLSNKIIDSGREYLMVLETGNLEPLTEGPTKSLLNLASENELLLDGQQVLVVYTDDHKTHIQEHSAIISDPTVRQDPAKIQTVLAHIQEHMNILMTPEYQQYLQIMNQPALGGAGGPPGMGGGGQPQPGNANANPGGVLTPNGATPQSSAAILNKAAGITPAKSPVNPMSGQRPPLAGPV